MEKQSKNFINDGIKKQIVQDVDTPRTGGEMRRSIRDIPIPTNGGVSKKQPSDASSDTENISHDEPRSRVDEVLSDHPRIPHQKRDMSKIVLWAIVFASVIALVFAVSSLFAGATVTITPKQQQVTLNDTLSASAGNQPADLSYQIVQISDTVSRVVDSDSEAFMEQKASGKIIIFNNYSTATQELIEQTRFETPDGKIYRIQEPITVPGKSGDTPGQIEVTVVADQVGPEYNIGLTEFTIPGFRGDPRFEDFSARSKTTMAGGFSGTVPVVNEETKNRTETELQDLLKERLSSELTKRISTNLLVPENSTFYTFEALPATKNAEGAVELIHKGTLHAITLTSANFADTILTRAGEKTETPVRVDNINELSLTLLEPEKFDIQTGSLANIQVSGDAHLVWVFDEEQIKQALTGQKKKALSKALEDFDAIEKAHGVIRPFWKRSFPTSVSKIKVKTELD